MSGNISLNDFLREFDEGKYGTTNVHTMIHAGWFDWFCKDVGLKNRLIPMAQFIKKLKKSKLFNFDEMYAFFKNNCPMVGPLYDSFGIQYLGEPKKRFYVWVAFINKGCHGVDHSRTEVCMEEWMLEKLKDNPAIVSKINEKEDGSFGKPFSFATKTEAAKFLNSLEFPE